MARRAMDVKSQVALARVTSQGSRAVGKPALGSPFLRFGMLDFSGLNWCKLLLGKEIVRDQV
jgi:hypothetical protein